MRTAQTKYAATVRSRNMLDMPFIRGKIPNPLRRKSSNCRKEIFLAITLALAGFTCPFTGVLAADDLEVHKFLGESGDSEWNNVTVYKGGSLHDKDGVHTTWTIKGNLVVEGGGVFVTNDNTATTVAGTSNINSAEQFKIEGSTFNGTGDITITNAEVNICNKGYSNNLYNTWLRSDKDISFTGGSIKFDGVTEGYTQEIAAKGALSLSNASVDSRNGTWSGKTVSITGGSFRVYGSATTAITATDSFTLKDNALLLVESGSTLDLTTGSGGGLFTGSQVLVSGTMNVEGAATFTGHAKDSNADSTSYDIFFDTSGATLTFDTAPIFTVSDSTEKVQIGVGYGGSPWWYWRPVNATIKATNTENLDLSAAKVIVNNVDSNLTVTSKNGQVTFGDMDVYGTVTADKADTTDTNEGTMILAGNVNLYGGDDAGGKLTAKEIKIAAKGATLTVDAQRFDGDASAGGCVSNSVGGYGRMESGSSEIDLTNLTANIHGSLTITPTAGTDGNKVVKVGDNFTVGEGGLLTINGSLKNDEDKGLIKLNGTDTAAATLAATDASQYTGTIQTDSGKVGNLSGRASSGSIDLSQATLKVDGALTAFVGDTDSNKALTVGNAEVAGVLDLTGATEVTQADDAEIALKGTDAGTGLLKLTASQGTDSRVAGLHVHATTANNGVVITGAIEADFSDLAMTVAPNAVLTLSLDENANATTMTYNNIGKTATVANEGDLHLAGKSVTFSLGTHYSGSGIISFDEANAARTISTDKASFAQKDARFHIGATATPANNVFEITDTSATDALDLTKILENGWFNTEHTANSSTAGTGKISGDGILTTVAAEIGGYYNDTRIELAIDELKSEQESVSIGGLVSVAEVLAFDDVKTLTLAENGLLNLGTNDSAATMSLAKTDVSFAGGQMVVNSNAETADPTLTVKSLTFSDTAGAGSLTINDNAQVKVTGDATDYSKRYFNANGNENQVVTLDGAGAKLIVSAKDLLVGDTDSGTGVYKAADKAGVIGGYGTLKITDFVAFAQNDQGLDDTTKPKLNVTQFLALRKSLKTAGSTTANPYDVLIEFDRDAVEGFFDEDGNIDRSDLETKEFLSSGVSASGKLVYNVSKYQAADENRQQWGAAQLEDNEDTLIIGSVAGTGTNKDVTLDNAGAGTGDKETDKNYFVRYDDSTGDPTKKDQLGNIKFVENDAKATLIGGGVIGTVTINEGVTGADIIFKNSKGNDPDSKEGFASGTINIPDNNVTADHADVVIGLSEGYSPENLDRDAGKLTAKDLTVKNDSTVTVKGTTTLDNVYMGNDAKSGADGNTNKVTFAGDATIGSIIADGAKVTSDTAGASGLAEVAFNTTGTNAVTNATVAKDNTLTLTGKATVGTADIGGTFYAKEGIGVETLNVYNADTPAQAYMQPGTITSKAQVGGADGNGFLYLGKTESELESPNEIAKTWDGSAAALAERYGEDTAFTGIGYLDENGYSLLNAEINIGTVTTGAANTITVGKGGALIVSELALTAPEAGNWNYSAGLAGNVNNESGTVMVSNLSKIGNKTTIQLAGDDYTVTGGENAQWGLYDWGGIYELTLKDNILYASFNEAGTDKLLGKVDKDLADKIKEQSSKDQSEGGGFDTDRKDGLGFISKVLADTVGTDTGVDFDASAERVGRTLTSSTRFGVLGGAVQNSQAASGIVTAQIEERAGFRTSTASRMATDNDESGTLWASPLYHKIRSRGLDAGAYTYSLNTELHGVSIGGDRAVSKNIRVGAAFSAGKGDSDSRGSLMKTTNDFDFYSGSLYAIRDVGNVTVLADIDYTWLKGDVKQMNNITTLKSTVKSNITSVGVSAKRTFESTGGLVIAPYAGVRLNRLHVNGYDVKDADDNTIIRSGSQNQYYATIPVGVQLSKNFQFAKGFVKPVLDLGVITTAGSRNFESLVTYTGFGDTRATSEVRDRAAFTLKFGVNGESGNFGYGLGYGLTCSSSTTSQQLYGNIRYRF